jgi:UDP-GlcNAc:undecaprenyl-phosphate GlcNAc-1-phosphate transferase
MFESPSNGIIDLPGIADGNTLAGGTAPAISFILPLVAALVISMILIPLMTHLAPRIGMVDLPDARKVHARPVPRVGGVGIVFGALLPVLFLLPLDQSWLTYLAGALVVFVFGALDDSHELNHYVKFIGQFIAVIGVVYIGDVYVTNFPFMGGEPLSEAIGKPFTVIAMVGMINAINHSDGLDGLAGGESLISLCAIAYLAYLSGGYEVVIISLAIIGGLLGFIRFNTHPAVIFMGDSGSQFLGFSLGYLAVLLTQDVNPALSPALPLLLLGLPIADIIAVFIQRIYKKMNWFRATRNHIHHRLLDLGFHHYESVIVIYSVHLLLVILALLMPYEADGLIAGAYLAVISVVFVFLVVVEKTGWMMRTAPAGLYVDALIESAKHSKLLVRLAYGLVYFGLSLFLITGAVLATRVPVDLGIAGLILCLMLLARLIVGGRLWLLPLRLLSYMAIMFVVYLLTTYQPEYLSGTDPATYLFFGGMVLAIGVLVRFKEFKEFNTTPTDFLIVIAVLALVVLSGQGIVSGTHTAIVLKAIILFYACEIVLGAMNKRLNFFNVSVLLSLAVITGRGFLQYLI